jgi:phytoene dehydrogenase-like protein
MRARTGAGGTVMERYDVAIIGAGPEGLIAATALARAKRRVIVLERQGRAGGRAETYEFHPGFKASPYADEFPAIPARLFRALDLARAGVLLAPAPASACVSDSGTSVVFADEERAWRAAPSLSRDGFLSLRRDVENVKLAIDARALEPPALPEPRFAFWRRRPRPPWPGEDWGRASLDEYLRARLPDASLRLHAVADAVSGRAVSPFLAGTALHLLAPGTGRSGLAAGGMGVFGAALWSVAANAGSVFRCGKGVAGILIRRGRATGVTLADGEEISAAAVLSTLDLKQTFLRLVARGDLDDTGFTRVGRYRIAGQQARILIALESPPELAGLLNDPDLRLSPIHVVASLEAIGAAHDSWRAGFVPETPLVTLRLPSLLDPRLAPPGKAVMTATLSAIPCVLADGAWTQGRREALAQLALQAAERVAPGVTQRVISVRTIVPPDVEKVLGATDGDLDGGEFAPDQAFGFRPFGGEGVSGTNAWRDGRTPIAGLYHGGPSSAPSPVLLGASGGRAARTILADLESERLK